MGSRLKFFFAELIIVVAVLKRIVGDANSNNLAPRKVGGRNAARESILVIFFLEQLERGKHARNVFSWKFPEPRFARTKAPSVRRDRRTGNENSQKVSLNFPKSRSELAQNKSNFAPKKLCLLSSFSSDAKLNKIVQQK